MRLHLVEADARDVAADVQFVKHFDGLFGGAERVLDIAIDGKIRALLNSLELEAFGRSRLIEVTGRAPIKSANLLLMGLGKIERFSIQNLQAALVHAMEESLHHNFATIATPVIGIGDHAGLPIEGAYAVALYSILSVLLDYVEKNGRQPCITDVTIFDNSAEKVAIFSKMTSDALTKLGVKFKRFSEVLYYIELIGAIGSVERVIPAAERKRYKAGSEPVVDLPQVFISHSSQDKWFAREIVNALEGLPLRAFLDERSIDYGQPIDEMLIQGLKQCDAVILIVSESSAQSDWVKYEIGAAWTLDKHIVPVKLSTVEPPIVASRLRYIDATQNQFEAIRELKEHFTRRYKTK